MKHSQKRTKTAMRRETRPGRERERERDTYPKGVSSSCKRHTYNRTELNE